jgi:lysophospholipase L1-like esterase
LPASRQPVQVQGPPIKNPLTALLSRPVLAVLILLGLGLLAQLTPAFERVRLFTRPPPPPARPAPPMQAPVLEIGESEIESETLARPELAQPEEVALPKSARGPIAGRDQAPLPSVDAEKPPIAIVDPGTALDGFYADLEQTARKTPGAITRVLHFGDSIVVSDYISGTLRRKLQAQFGDAGHGFMLMANAWPAYFHNDVYRFASSGWLVSRVVGPLTPDGLYGLGGVSFRAPPGSRARFGTARSGRFGRAVSRFVIIYLEQPDGGTFKLNLDGKPWGEIDTNAAEKKVAYRTVEAPDGEHELEVVTASGFTRAFGVVMERELPGVVLDAIGIQGARIRFLDKHDDAHWAEQLKSRDPSLLVYQFGANESGDGFAYPMVDYNRTMRDVLRQGKHAVPDAGCLVVAAMDRAEKRGTDLTSMAVIPAIVEEQRKASAAEGCAFFDTYRAMGGPGSMPAWVARGLGQADLTHPTGAGSEVLGNWIYRALMQGYDAYLARKQ